MVCWVLIHVHIEDTTILKVFLDKLAQGLVTSHPASKVYTT